MGKKEPDKKYEHVRKELKEEKKISVFQIISIIILLILAVLLAIFSDDSAVIPTWIREFVRGQ